MSAVLVCSACAIECIPDIAGIIDENSRTDKNMEIPPGKSTFHLIASNRTNI